MRIGLFGGTFDPVHLGHLILAESCREAALDEVWFVPSFSPPHKLGVTLTRFESRVDMATLATTGQPAFKVEPIEKELPIPSYTVQTVAALKERHPDAEFALILGADGVPDLPQWHEPQRLAAEVGFLVVGRPGFERWPADRLAAALGLPPGGVRLTAVESPPIGVASRDLRRRVAEGKSIRYLVPRAVEEYVRERRLYRPAR